MKVCIALCHNCLLFSEKTGLAEEIKAKQELIQQRKGEVEGMQGDIDEASRQREALERERDKARNLLEELNNEACEYHQI